MHGGRNRTAALAVLAALAVPFVVLGLIQSWDDAPTWDEGIYLASGVTTLTQHQLRINLEHPPLGKILAAAPALLAHPVIPIDESFRAGQEFDYAGHFVEAQRRAGRLREVVFLGRIVPLIESVAVAFVLYALGAELFGPGAGAVAGALWLTNPFFLGLGHVLTIDVPATLTVLVGALLVVRLLRRPSWGRVAALGVSAGAALLVRSTGLVLLPLLAGAAAWAMVRVGEGARGRAAQVARAAGAGATVAGIAWASVWAGIRLLSPHPWAPPPAAQVVIAGAASRLPWSARLATLVPWPREYADGIRYLARVSTPPGPGFVLGHAFDGGRWWYWPAAMLVKLPLTTLAALACGVVALAVTLARRRDRDLTLTWLVAVAAPALTLALFVVTQPRDQGLRYLAPVLALLAVSAGPIAMVGRWLAGRMLLGALVVAQLAMLWTSHPHALTWTAPPFRPAYRVEADANLDWNQDFYRFQQWAATRQPWVAYFGLPSIPLESVPGARQLLHADAHAVTGWVAVFGSLLTTYDREPLSWLRAYCPVGTIGGSIVLYHLEGPPDLRPGPPVPARECPGAWSRRVAA